MPMDDRWEDTGDWIGDDLRREAFFFASRGEQLYGSLYAASPASGERPAAGVALCNSWGFEGNQSDATIQRIALAVARAGGAALVFHYPGFGDSHGTIAEATMDSLVSAVVDAVAEACRRLPGTRWTLAGMMFGASVAGLAAERIGIERLLLVQPALQPSRYFARLERSARRAAVRVPARAGNAYGYPLPHRILAAAEQLDAEIAGALDDFDGEGAVVRYAEPPRGEAVPERFEDVVLPGAWRFGARQKPELAKAASECLQRAAVEVGE
jgi:alpha/beta superfamily hydrolase